MEEKEITVDETVRLICQVCQANTRVKGFDLSACRVYAEAAEGQGLSKSKIEDDIRSVTSGCSRNLSQPAEDFLVPAVTLA